MRGRKGRALIYNLKKKSGGCARSLNNSNANSPYLVLYRQGRFEVVLRGLGSFQNKGKEKGRN